MKSKKPAILYVDDERENLMIFKTTFRRTYQVLTAQSAHIGLEILEKNPDIQVVITDQRMPEMTGVEFIEQIVQKYPDIVRMIMTGYSDIEAIIQGINKGQIYHYITKPWEHSELKITIDQAIERFQLKRENQLLLDSLQKSNQELERQNHKVLDTNQELDRFLYSTSHDLKGPIARLLGLVQLAKLELIGNSVLSDYIQRFEATAQDMADMVDKLSVLHGVTHAHVEPETFILLDFVQLHSSPFSEKIKIEWNISSKIEVASYPSILEQIFKVILENAIAYQTTHRFKTSQIRITAQQNETNWQLVFWDNGIGISEEMQPKIFQMFFRGAEQSKGHGLGLYLAQKATTRLKGKIEVRSIEEEFTEFTFTFPNDGQIEAEYNLEEYDKGFFLPKA